MEATAASSQATRSTHQAVARVVGRQHTFQRARRPLPIKTRRDQLRRLREAVRARRDELQDALYADFRKPAEEVDLAEVHPVLAEADHALDHLAQWMHPERTSAPWTLLGTRSEIRREPKGVVLIVSPWNYPVPLTFGPLVSALAAGNSAVLKPSELTPHASAVMRAIVEDTFDPREVALFEGDKAVAQALLEQPFDHIFFTGSPAVGKVVMKAAAERLTSVTLELGGKSPAVVDETADVEDAARKIVWGKFTNAGQTCIAPDYVLVHERVEAPLIDALRRQIRRFYGETDAVRRCSSDYARLVSDRHFARVKALLDDAVERGARVAEGGKTHAAECYIAPTLLTDVPADADALNEEIFGPLLPIASFETLDAAVEVINSKPNPLALYVFSGEEENVERVLRRTTAGGSCVNDVLVHYLNPSLPFGGAGHSGIGRAHGHSGFKAFSNERAVVHRTFGSSALRVLYPPYGSTARRLISGLLRWL